MTLAAISNYFYLPYQCAKDTKSVIPSVVILASTNVLMNFILVPKFGIYGVVFTAILSYTFTTIYLWKDTKKYFKLYFYHRTFIPIVFLIISILPFYIFKNHYLDATYIFVSFSIIFYSLPKNSRKEFLMKIKNKVVHRKQTT